jgi:hypothetical protein
MYQRWVGATLNFGYLGHGRPKLEGAGGVLTNLSNLRIAMVKELHQLERKSVSEFGDMFAKFLKFTSSSSVGIVEGGIC